MNREHAQRVVEHMKKQAPMNPSERKAFIAGYEKAKLDAIDRCLIEKLPKSEHEWRSHNVAASLCAVAIRALDVRHALEALKRVES